MLASVTRSSPSDGPITSLPPAWNGAAVSHMGGLRPAHLLLLTLVAPVSSRTLISACVLLLAVGSILGFLSRMAASIEKPQQQEAADDGADDQGDDAG